MTAEVKAEVSSALVRNHKNRVRIKKLQEQIKNLMADNFTLSEHLESMEQDRDRYRKVFLERLLWWPALMTNNQTPNLEVLLKQDIRTLSWCEKARIQE